MVLSWGEYGISYISVAGTRFYAGLMQSISPSREGASFSPPAPQSRCPWGATARAMVFTGHPDDWSEGNQ